MAKPDNPNNCATCKHKQHPDGGHCYMFRFEPTEMCAQHTSRTHAPHVLRTERKQMTYETNPRNLLQNGLTVLQVNPDCAAQLDARAKDYGWLYTKGADGRWVTLRKLSDGEIEIAHDQAADMAVLQGTQVRAG